uniref:Uncharacterized protein n=1 Tax=Chromera velia CCMP2878 TaxID=1169474 RepID=A0A0G4I3A4_9ALVE|eukprot:Cvel_10608.t1-p1 / transcript=Cvel_10608.t1 / gene=Cvel_10608 / organism=Chromera_velia_CCMP2878 / gene_product=hypothetical protein / transcript_product=hypothetical protein / location=Cvel_scaffold643:69857-71914(+) / protein_length=245 / sequence_SO=supercontig / SO=protein_coding / is_pseudo=false
MFRSYVFRFGVGSSFSRLELPVLWNSPERGDRWFVVFKPPGFSLERTEGGGKERPSVQEVFEPLIPSKSQMLFPLHLDPDVEGLVPVALDTVMYEQIRKDIARGATRIRYRLLVHSSKDDPGLAELATSLLSPDAPPELEAEQRASAAGEERGATWKEEERGRCTACRSGEADTLERGGGMRPEDGVGLAGHVQGWTKMEGDGDGDGRMEENLYAGPSLLSAESLRFLVGESVSVGIRRPLKGRQ